MKYKGITYDIGTEYTPGYFTVDELTAHKLQFDFTAIKNQLNCNAVRIYGKDIGRLSLAADIALKTGLHVWFSPRMINAGIGETLMYLQKAAKAAQLLKENYPMQDVVFIIAGEATIDIAGFVAGSNIHERIKNMMKPAFFIKNALGIKPGFQKKFDRFLTDATSVVKNEFNGKVTYAGAMWERVDWTGFDFVAMNLYKASFNASHFNKTLKALFSKQKPVIITEFGCCSYDGADKKGPAGYFVLNTAVYPPVFNEPCIRNEQVQADYLTDLLKTYDDFSVEGTFVFDFQTPKTLHNTDPDKDYDMVSFGVTKTIEDGSWQPKRSYYAVAEYYKASKVS
jgi:hypothetical protein